MFSISDANIPTGSDTPVDFDAITVKVGQMWRWNFTVGSGWWLLQAVSDAARRTWKIDDMEVIKRNDVFIVVDVNDDGPALPGSDIDGKYTVEQVELKKTVRHHVVLLNDRLVWIQHKDFSICELVQK